VFSSAAEILAPNIRRPTVREALDIIHGHTEALKPEEVR
jgi:hypothetical protein